MKEDQFVIVYGNPKAESGAHLSILNGGEYIIFNVEVLTLYKIRDAVGGETISAPNHIGVEDSDIKFINVNGDPRSRGISIAVKHMERQNKP